MRAYIVPVLALWVSGCGLVLDVDPKGPSTGDAGGRDGASDGARDGGREGGRDTSIDTSPVTCADDDQCEDCSLCVDGLCVPAPVGSPCSGGACDGTGVCGNECIEDAPCETGNVCEIGQWACDAAGGGSCTPRGREAAGTECRPAAGLCDLADFCNGIDVACPVDVVRGADYECRGADGLCNPPERCDGFSPMCPEDGGPLTPGTPCGDGDYCNAAGACAGCPDGDDCTPEGTCQTHIIVCEEGTPDCQPTADPVRTGHVCRRRVGRCDAAERCDGTSLVCPRDALAGATTECRSAVDDCDRPEFCTAVSNACPIDEYRSATYTCRPSAGPCDQAESCTGTSEVCPADQMRPGGTICDPTGVTGPCDIEDTCDGISPGCLDRVEPPGTLCGADTTACRMGEFCDGATGDCRAGPVRPEGAACGCGQCRSGYCSDPGAAMPTTCPMSGFYCCIPSPNEVGYCQATTLTCPPGP